jgi:membrane associated rhomboid family serine protease
VVNDKQYWRAITSTFSHLNLLHIAFNCMSLWNVGYIETRIGAARYLTYTYLLVMFSTLTIYGIQWLLIHKFDRQEYRNSFALGYSAVVFGWLSINVVVAPGAGLSLGFMTIPNIMLPFFYLLICQLLIQNASFIGHLAGIVCGFMLGWGWFDWVTTWLFCILLIATVGFFLYNVHQTTAIFGGASTDASSNSSNTSTRVVNGVVVREVSEHGSLFGGFKNPLEGLNLFHTRANDEFDVNSFDTSSLGLDEHGSAEQKNGLLASEENRSDVGPTQV